MKALIGSVALASASVAQANCPAGDDVFLHCQIEGSVNQLTVCSDATQVTYRYGPAGAPDLELTESIRDVDYTPWPGVSSTIWEEVAFENKGYRYSVFGAIHRDYGDGPDDEVAISRTGGVSISQGAEELATFACAPASIDFAWGGGLWDAKEALGLEYDYKAKAWINNEN